MPNFTKKFYHVNVARTISDIDDQDNHDNTIII